ncbi:uncharacterized protein LOC115426100 isoform X2 [Sphaeramia orbicularis]|uniref:uncharacterized protein LOC115426100 isoform X2 n=1 Tax=Sphaeramia orbicularis TaxID=375764 RepID=UPI00117C807A|nr:uncharacterized protein LOC115426100 isoform X2 [Sphaeramia orbicularis]
MNRAGHVPKKHGVVEPSCKPKQMTALTRSQVEASLTSFDAANGKHLGTWSPGFPLLHLDQNTPLVGADVQCSLLFMSQGVEAILVDQRDNLNPDDVSLHKTLSHTVSRIGLLEACVKSILGGTCAAPPPPPHMPKPVFERKQWSHTLLKEAREYLVRLERKIGAHIFKVKGSIKQRIKHMLTMKKYHKYLEGSGYLL